MLKTIVLFEYFVKIHMHHERRIFFLGKTMNGKRQGYINGLKRYTVYYLIESWEKVRLKIFDCHALLEMSDTVVNNSYRF